MSTIGPGSIGALNLAGSVAGSQRSNADKDETRATASERSSRIDHKKMSSESLDDVAEADLSPDRDADGQQPFNDLPTDELLSDESDDQQTKLPRGIDAAGERGTSLDLEV